MGKTPFLSIGRKLLIAILFASGFLTFIFTLISFYLDYQTETSLADKLFSQINASSVSPMVESVYNVNDKQITTIAQGILNINDVIKVEVLNEERLSIHKFSKDRVPSVGFNIESAFWEYTDKVEWPLSHQSEGYIGSLIVTITKSNMYARLARKALYVFFSQGLKTLVISFFILYIVRKLIVKHLGVITGYWTHQDLGSTMNEKPLKIERNSRFYDEIDLLVDDTNLAFERIWSLNRKVKDDLDIERSLTHRAMSLAGLSDMAAGVAHEINNPLGIIKGFSQIIDRQLKKEEINREFIIEKNEVILRTVNRISKITKGLLEFSRDPSLDTLEEVNLEALLTRVQELSKIHFEKQWALSKLSISGLSPEMTVYCREKQVVQALFNLVSNGIDAVLEQEGDDRFIAIQVKETPSRIILELVNSGPKISSEVASKMFVPFYTTKQQGKGTGLGLCIALGLVESNYGTLQYDRDASLTTFVLSFRKKESGSD